MRHPITLTAFGIVLMLFAAMIVTSCSKDPMSSSQSLSMTNLPQTSTSMKPVAVGGPPGYEPAYVNGTTVLINAIEVKQNPTDQAQADFYEVVYPFDPATGQELTDSWPLMPQCNPCDHLGDGDTPDDYHDHVLDSRPSDPTGREYNALWRVYLIMPNYTDNANHNAAVNDMLESLLPAKSEDAVDAILSTEVDGLPIAIEIDTHFYFICDVVGKGAGSH
jgi:hypothetical protein